MEKNNYWIDFWNKNKIIYDENSHSQIGRTIKGNPINDNLWDETLSFIFNQLEINPNDNVLDVCAGTGMISIPLSSKVKKITALDISAELLKKISNISNIDTVLADVRTHNFKQKKFSKIIFYFALQHFSIEETVKIFEKLFLWLEDDGIAYIGDIPDINSIFNFYNNKEREELFFKSLKNKTPILGTWFHQQTLHKLAKHVGFKEAELIIQPKNFINSHYRFDLKLKK